ncbi:phage major capsid protein [Demequina globuliformis]|uniref:phage major capsid protein n=1 Tax=Demequina globuliformis TaxID=676202 RepID=UPI00078451C6|nr:phage major capsid protein [Demequina globuliformis]
MVDINRGTTGVNLPPEVSQEIWQDIQDASVVMGLARRVSLSGAGTVYHEVLTDSEPAFVGETERKPVSNATVGNKTLVPHKIAVVQTYSDEFRRDLPGLFNALVSRLPGALGKTFDNAAIHGIGAPASNFDDLSGASGVSILNTTPGSDDAYAGFLAALGAVPNLSAWALAPAGEILALGNRDTSGSPIITQNVQTEGSVGSILARPVFRSANAGTETTDPHTVGIAGDWSKAVWGQVEGVSIDISDNPVYAANGDLISAGWQDNMISVRAEIHVGFIADTSKFVRLTGTDPV